MTLKIKHLKLDVFVSCREMFAIHHMSIVSNSPVCQYVGP